MFVSLCVAKLSRLSAITCQDVSSLGRGASVAVCHMVLSCQDVSAITCQYVLSLGRWSSFGPCFVVCV